MRDWQAYRARFVRDDVNTRIGGVAANFARIQSAAGNDAHFEIVRNMIQDSEYLLEWTAPDAKIETAGELVEMQVQLAYWHRVWHQIWNERLQRQAMAAQVGKWSEHLLDISGLLNER